MRVYAIANGNSEWLPNTPCLAPFFAAHELTAARMSHVSAPVPLAASISLAAAHEPSPLQNVCCCVFLSAECVIQRISVCLAMVGAWFARS